MASPTSDNDIAVIGTSCRVAGANSPSELWDILASSRDVQSKITRFNVDGFYHPEGASRKGLTNVRHAYMLDDDCIDKFDNAFFYTTPQEAIAMDPQQRMLLEIAYEAIESAGIPLDDFMGTDTAVFAGMEGCDYHTVLARDIDATPRYLATGTPTCMAANRLSYFYNLSGPSLAVDTACSSTMAALHQAVRTLQHGDAGMALVCGAKLVLNPDMFIPSSELGFLSPYGKCQTFDAAADGYGRGEGVLALLLKPLSKAVADGDAIRAVIRGTRLNQDGRTQGITLPSAEAQRRNMEALYAELDILPEEIQYLEAHGTGTAAGDPLEFSAIQSVYGPSRQEDSPLIIGSVKSNIGHLESCSALASFVKVIECLERGQIPPQMHFQNPNPKIDFKNVRIPTKIVEWPPTGRTTPRAAINTFGAGGTNGHAVLEHYPKPPIEPVTNTGRPYLFKVSAADNDSLRNLSLEYAHYVEERRPCLRDVAYTLLCRRSTLRKAIYLTARSIENLASELRSHSHKVHTKSQINIGQTVFVFTGQGAQWPQMGGILLDQSPLFRSVLEECDGHFAKLPDAPSWSLIDELEKPKDQSNVYRARFSQPLCTALQLGLIALLDSWDIKPNVVVGHSSGEIAAAYAAGYMSLRDAIVTAYYRGLSLESPRASSEDILKGSMCAVGLSEDQSKKLLADYGSRLQVAAVNSSTSTTISGDANAIEEIEAACLQNGIFCRRLRTGKAYHSHHMLGPAARYETLLRQAGVSRTYVSPTCKMFSSVTGQEIEAEDCTPMYWKDNMVSTVLFSQALSRSIGAHPAIGAVVEIGPHPALKGPIAEILKGLDKTDVEYFHTFSRGENDFVSLLANIGAMIAHGAQLSLAKVNADIDPSKPGSPGYKFGSLLTDLPRYQWNHSQGFWAESRMNRRVRFRQCPRHQLLGSRGLDDIPTHPSWRNHLLLKEIPWLADLKSKATMNVPSTMFLIMALEAARQMQIESRSAASSLIVSNVDFDQPLQLHSVPENEPGLEIKLIAKHEESTSRFQFEIMSVESDSLEKSVRHCTGSFGWQQDSVADAQISACDIAHDAALLDCWKALGNTVPDILHQLRAGSEGCAGRFEQSLNPYDNYSIDPRVLDDILSIGTLPLIRRTLPAIYRLVSVESVTGQILNEQSSVGDFAINLQSEYPFGARCDLEICHGGKSLSLNGLRYQATEPLIREPAPRPLFFQAVSMPDISYLAPFTLQIPFADLARLISHKWPMSDIQIQKMSNEHTQIILDEFRAYDKDQRPMCRSLTIQGPKPQHIAHRAEYLEDFDPSQHYHVLLTGHIDHPQEIYSQLPPGGLVCLFRSRRQKRREIPTEFFERAAECGHGHPKKFRWDVWRKKPSVVQIEGHNVVLFEEPPSETFPRNTLFRGLQIQVEKILLMLPAVSQFCQRSVHSRIDAIVIDLKEKSVIASWPGEVFIPWMQTLLKCADSLLWVTGPDSTSPSHKLAGTLLRTLQSEQPSLKVSWLTVSGKANLDTTEEKILKAYASMLEGDKEIRRDLEGLQSVVRYYPDDELSIGTGLIPPRKFPSRLLKAEGPRFVDHSEEPLSGKNYAVSLTAPGKPVILSSRSQPQTLKYGETQIRIHASVVHPEELRGFLGSGPRNTLEPTPCRIFAGSIVTADQDEGVDCTLQRIVGYTTGSIQKDLVVPESQTYKRFDDPAMHLHPLEACCEFAAIAVASCIVDGVARAREGDSFEIRLDGVLKVALHQLITKAGAGVINTTESTKADFTVTYSIAEGVLVNDQPFDLLNYLQSQRGQRFVEQAWQSRRLLSCPLQSFTISHIDQAFEHPITQSQPYSTAIEHVQGQEDTLTHVPIYIPPATLFSSAGQYVLIGGLGGLGRFICTWMVEHGAQNLVAISRSGLSSPEAHETQAAITALGASLQVFAADACDRERMQSILASLRLEAPIKGVINLAMILGDAPMASMTGEEWDRALRVKIDSSWILHEEMMEDELDFFILFSSIASVCGNRNQGNYNVGNTFLNALAEYRQSLDRPGISIALGAMTDMGVLYSLSKANMLDILTRSGLSHLTKTNLAKTMEAAILESPRRDRSLIVTGLEMFERDTAGILKGRTEPLFWAELPEFSHLQTYDPPESSTTAQTEEPISTLKQQVQRLQSTNDIPKPEREAKLQSLISDAFLSFLSSLVGWSKDAFDTSSPLSMYGIDSLSGVSCQYWFYRELGIDMPVMKILGGDSIDGIVKGVCTTLLKDRQRNQDEGKAKD